MPNTTPQEISQNISTGRNFGFQSLASVFGFVAILCSWWSCIVFFSFTGKPLVITTHIDGYRPATFTIEKLIFDRNADAQKSYATGIVNGQVEEFNFGAYLREKPTSQYELEQLFSVGQQLKVRYNPDVSDPVEARVVFPTENFGNYWRKALMHALRMAYLPMGIAIGLSLLAGLAGRSWVGAKLAAASMFFPIFSWVVVLIFGW